MAARCASVSGVSVTPASARRTRRRSITRDRKSTRLNSSHLGISYAVFCLKKKISQRDLRLMYVVSRLNAIRKFATREKATHEQYGHLTTMEYITKVLLVLTRLDLATAAYT